MPVIFFEMYAVADKPSNYNCFLLSFNEPFKIRKGFKVVGLAHISIISELCN
jgi:hypothetical protein